MLTSALASILTAAALSLAPAASATTGPAASSEETAAFAAAKQDFNGGRYLEAARAFDTLWDTHQVPKYLHYAALAWATAGEDARAILRWRRLLSLAAATPDEMKEAERRLEGARARTTALNLTVAPPPTSEARIVLLRQGSAAGPLELTLADLAGPGGALLPIFLEPGAWTITLRPGDPRLAEAQSAISVDASTPSRDLRLDLPLASSRLELTITPPAALVAGVTIILQESEGRAPEQRLQASGGRLSVPLVVGTWRLHAESPGVPAIDEEIVVHAGQPTQIAVQFAVEEAPEPELPPEVPAADRVRHPKLALGLGIGAGVSAVLGGVLIGVGEARIATSAKENTRLATGCEPQLRPSDTYRTCMVEEARDILSSGGLFVGSAVGLGVTALANQRGLRPSRWLYPLLGGILASAGGATWYFVAFGKEPMRGEAPPHLLTHEQVATLRASYYPSTLLVGLGAGLTLGATASLVSGRRPRTQDRAVVQLSPLPRGASLAVHF